MKITDLFDINIEKVYFKDDAVIGYDVTLFSEAVGDFDVVHIKIENSLFPCHFSIDEFSISVRALDIINENYLTISAFKDDLLGYIYKLIADEV